MTQPHPCDACDEDAWYTCTHPSYGTWHFCRECYDACDGDAITLADEQWEVDCGSHREGKGVS